MLADELIGMPAQQQEIEKVFPPQREGYVALAENVLQAQRFVLQREAVFLIHSVAQIAPSRLIPAMQICRMPFPRMWVEFTYKDRDDWHQFAKIDRSLIPDASSPSRLGFYIEQTDAAGRKMEVTLVWRHNNDPNAGGKAIVIGGYSMMIDTSDGVVVTDAIRANYERVLKNPTPQERQFGANKAYTDPRDNEAAMELEARINVGYSLYMAPLWDHIATEYPQELPQHKERALFDTLQEWRFVLGLLMVLNSRNIVRYSDPITFEKLNKQRKLKGVPPLHPHREIRLGLSHVQRNRLGSGSTLELMAHLVRGHFKVRRTGLFWWSPHVRGKGDPPVGKPYIVKGPHHPGA